MLQHIENALKLRIGSFSALFRYENFRLCHDELHAEERPILENLCRSGSTLPASLTASRAFGLLENGSLVMSACCTVDEQPCTLVT